MSIPLIQKAEKNDINTSIIAIKRQIERINTLLGLSNSEEIDTSVFATKDELQQAVTDLQPVDEVTADNMHSVTSNGVAESLSYSETEVKTGGKWIDNAPIYQKVIYVGNASLGSSNNFPHNIQNLGTVIHLERHFVYNNTHYMMWDGSPTMTVNNTNIAVSGASSLSVTKLYFVIKYTKTTN